MAREVEVALPEVTGGSMMVIPFQDLPGKQVGAFHLVPESMKAPAGISLLALAAGPSVDLSIYSWREMLSMYNRWQAASEVLESETENDSAPEVDWSGLL